MQSPAERTYLAYCAAVGGTTHDNKPLPTFAQLDDRQKEGWTAAADSLGLPVKVGGPVTTKQGIKGTVRSVNMEKNKRRGLWLEGIDSTGRPFDHFIDDSEILIADEAATGQQGS